MTSTGTALSTTGAGTSSATSETKAPSAAFPFLDLRAQYLTIRDEIAQATAGVFENQHFILGEEVRLFENEVAAFLGAKHAIGCASGSDALVLALMACGVGPGDEVITSAFTFVATAGAIARVGAMPVFADVDPLTFNIDPDQVKAAITSKTRAIMPVHLFGLPADVDPLCGLAKENELRIIEDAAQAIGAGYHGRTVGTIGDFGCFSFFPSKNLGGAGDGGMVATNSDEMADQLRMLRVHGSNKKYHHQILGMNSRLDALQAAVLRVKLRYLPSWTKARQERADIYRALFEQADSSRRITVPETPESSVHVYNQFVISCPERDALREHLTQRGIPTEIYYPVPLHLQPAFAYLGYRADRLPRTEAACKEVLALPIYPELTEAQQAMVVREILNFELP